MEIEKLNLNDTYAQFLRKIRKQSDEEVEKRKNEIIKCNHLFIKLEDGVYIGGFHSSDCYYEPSIVECVHCGLTNKFNKLEELYNDRDYLSYFLNTKTIESDMFNEIFRNYYLRGGKSFDESGFNLISNESLNTYHPSILYRLALSIKEDASNEEIFEIMKELSELETHEERFRLQSIKDASLLVERYKKSIGKIKVKR